MDFIQDFNLMATKIRYMIDFYRDFNSSKENRKVQQENIDHKLQNDEKEEKFYHDLEKRISKLQLEFNIVSRENDNLKARNDVLISKLFELKETISALKLELKITKEKLEKEEGDRENTSNEVKTIERNYKVLSSEYHSLLNQISLIQAILAKTKEEFSEVNIKCETHQLKLSDSIKTNSILQSNIDKLKLSQKQIQELLDVERAKVITLTSEKQISITKMEGLHTKISRLDNRLLNQSQQLTITRQENEAMKDILKSEIEKSQLSLETVEICKKAQKELIER
jgi:chromosome segregation ATPase